MPGDRTDAEEFWIDVGGTFTDCVARALDGTIRTHKLLSSGGYTGEVGAGSTRECIVDRQRRSDPAEFFVGYRLTVTPSADAPRDRSPAAQDDSPSRVVGFDCHSGTLRLDPPLAVAPMPGTRYELRSGEPAPITGIRWLMGKRLDDTIGRVIVKLGTTRGTNALLERQGAPVALVTTRGFADVLRIAEQNRPRLFDLHIRKPADLYREVIEVDERLDAAGTVLSAIDHSAVRAALADVRGRGIDALAVCLLHSYRNPIHEIAIDAIAREIGFTQISLSSRLSPLQKIVARGDTTVVDAYLTPIVRAYVAEIRARLPDNATLKLMTSAGGLIDAAQFVGKDSVLSGPAGGVVGQAFVARRAGFTHAIGFDMGGTSTDVSRFDGEYERRFEMEVNDPESDAGVRIVAPMLAIETVAAGGGSLCWFDGQKPVVGPRSAGADPGPACYGRGGPLAITDANLLLGRILPDHFAFPLDRAAVERRLDALIAAIEQATGQRYSRDALAAGFVTIANANMAAAIRKVSLARGYDVREYVLVSFGGAGAQHACAIARELGIRRVLLHPYAGVLSAFGIGMADVKRLSARDVSQAYGEETLAAIEPTFRATEDELRGAVRAEGVAADAITAARSLDLRYAGQSSEITVPRPNDDDYAAAFERRHRQRYGFMFAGRGIEIVAARVEVTGETPKPPDATRPVTPRRPQPSQMMRTFFDGAWHDTAVFERAALHAGDSIDGPAIVVEPISTIVVEPGWTAEVSERDNIVLTDSLVRVRPHPNPLREGEGADGRNVETPDAITLELFNNRFTAIAEQMGATLQRTSLSTNVKERLDFSCAIFTAAGELVVNAPHIPVHLGAMSDCVKALIDSFPDLRPGDVLVTNDPYRGGSHLPDVTVVTPVFDEAGRGLLFFTVSRAHHAEIGGIVPGSMPPFSRTLAEEGVVIRHFRLVQGERSSEAALRELLSSGPYPSRAVDENVADINAQAAANQTGVQQLLALVERYGLATVTAYMGHMQQLAEAKMRAALARLPPGVHGFTDQLDDGSPITVIITIRHGARGGEATVDFTGTGPVIDGNLNANVAIVKSAVLYCFRCLIDAALGEPADIPLNAGVLAPVSLIVPLGCLLNPPAHEDPARCAAVGGGNVETSQRVVDVIFGALGTVAASQGTMNNLTFGSNRFGYYETIGGGAGAGAGFDGADAIHTHMTNTRLTDPEVLEARYPVRLRRFAIRRNSGGAGCHRGGDGIVRKIEFLAPLEVSLLTGRRTSAPYGMAGGAPGARGRNRLRRADAADWQELGWAAQIHVEPGDVVLIETPGGGGYGRG
ncbi:MAG: hydantoinase B/oxoprolinase family protein [Deltaproteobacteria bacterium]|nr:hydantoinase B/oxoprolinase family protein [Deltaproteobacteria bacterium]MBI3390530.1 hydantoinase B/oxoprolinase family protein [Deltaproteobacteria bacterium]